MKWAALEKGFGKLSAQLPKAHSQSAGIETASQEAQLDRFIEFASQCYIRSGTKLIPFAPLYNYQVELARLAIAYPGLVIVKDRQLGITELFICWMLERAVSNPAYAGCTFSLTERDAFKASARVKRMPSRISDFEWAIDSLGLRQPKDGGEINFRPATDNATRGLESVWDLLFDEAGFLKNSLISEMYAASIPSQEMVGTDARTIIVSTIPREGIDTWFWEQFESSTPAHVNSEEMIAIAKNGGYHNSTKGAPTTSIPGFAAWEDESGWAKVVISHKAHPIYGADPEYLDRQRKRKKLTEEQLQREYNLTLPKNGSSLFDSESIDRYATGRWEDPKPSAYYLACIDPNMGGDDDWCLQIWRIDRLPFSLVACYAQSNMLPGHCRAESLRLIDRYNVVLLAIEKNNGGLGEAEKIASDRPKLRVEVINTSKISKIVNTDRIATALSDGDVRYPADWIGVKQLKRFDRRHREGINSKDDAVMCWAIGWSMLEQAIALKPRIRMAIPTGGEYKSPFEA